MVTLFVCIGVLFVALELYRFLSFLRQLRRLYPAGDNWMRVTCVDENGNQLGASEWDYIPDPERIRKNGLSHVGKYVARMVTSQATRCSLQIDSSGEDRGCWISTGNDQLLIYERSYLTPVSHEANRPVSLPETEREQAVRKLFQELQIAPFLDRVHEFKFKGDTYAVRDLVYPIGNEIERATMIIQRLLREVCGIKEKEGLDFAFSEFDE